MGYHPHINSIKYLYKDYSLYPPLCRLEIMNQTIILSPHLMKFLKARVDRVQPCET